MRARSKDFVPTPVPRGPEIDARRPLGSIQPRSDPGSRRHRPGRACHRSGHAPEGAPAQIESRGTARRLGLPGGCHARHCPGQASRRSPPPRVGAAAEQLDGPEPGRGTVVDEHDARCESSQGRDVGLPQQRAHLGGAFVLRAGRLPPVPYVAVRGCPPGPSSPCGAVRGIDAVGEPFDTERSTARRTTHWVPPRASRPTRRTTSSVGTCLCARPSWVDSTPGCRFSRGRCTQPSCFEDVLDVVRPRASDGCDTETLLGHLHNDVGIVRVMKVSPVPLPLGGLVLPAVGGAREGDLEGLGDSISRSRCGQPRSGLAEGRTSHRFARRSHGIPCTSNDAMNAPVGSGRGWHVITQQGQVRERRLLAAQNIVERSPHPPAQPRQEGRPPRAAVHRRRYVEQPTGGGLSPSADLNGPLQLPE